MSATSEPEPAPPFTQSREFCVLMGYAVALGVFGAFAGLVFMGVIGFGDNWYDDAHPGWFGGQWWWVAVTAGAGVLVGLLRRVTRLPEQIPGLIARFERRARRPTIGARITIVSAVSLIGGASLGPEKALGSIGGRSWRLDRPTTQAQPRRRAAGHLVRLRRRVRRAVLQHTRTPAPT